jgi:hypothetical protein
MPFTVNTTHKENCNITKLHFINPNKGRGTYGSLQNTEGQRKG